MSIDNAMKAKPPYGRLEFLLDLYAPRDEETGERRPGLGMIQLDEFMRLLNAEMKPRDDGPMGDVGRCNVRWPSPRSGLPMRCMFNEGHDGECWILLDLYAPRDEETGERRPGLGMIQLDEFMRLLNAEMKPRDDGPMGDVGRCNMQWASPRSGLPMRCMFNDGHDGECWSAGRWRDEECPMPTKDE